MKPGNRFDDSAPEGRRFSNVMVLIPTIPHGCGTWQMRRHFLYTHRASCDLLYGSWEVFWYKEGKLS